MESLTSCKCATSAAVVALDGHTEAAQASVQRLKVPVPGLDEDTVHVEQDPRTHPLDAFPESRYIT